jgi:hypothetical protein
VKVSATTAAPMANCLIMALYPAFYQKLHRRKRQLRDREKRGSETGRDLDRF